MQIRFLPEADAELVEARLWYRSQRDGLDVALMKRVDEALNRIIKRPMAFPIIHRNLRRALLRKFPFAIFYETRAEEIIVFAVFHLRRDPTVLRYRSFDPT